MSYVADEELPTTEKLSSSSETESLRDEISQERRRIASILDNSSEGILLLDATQRVYDLNPTIERITGQAREKIIGKPCWKILHAKDAQGRPICSKRCSLSTSDEGKISREGIITNRSGDEVEVELSCAIVPAENGELIGSVVSLRDLTRLRQLESVGSTLLATVSHELQTPISIIKAYASTLTRPDVEWEEETIREKLLDIEEESNPIACIYAVTGIATSSELASCREAGFDDYFTKPVEGEMLLKAAEDAFEKINRWKKT